MAARRPFWKWRRWKSIGFCLWPPSTCIRNLKFKFQSKLDLCSGNHVVYRQTDGRTDRRTRWIQYTPPPTSLGGGIIIYLFGTRHVGTNSLPMKGNQRFWNCSVLRHIPIKTQKGLHQLLTTCVLGTHLKISNKYKTSMMGPIPRALGPIRIMVCGSQGPIRK